MNLMELLLQVDARLRPLVGADEHALQAAVEEVAAGPRAEGIAPDVEPRAVLAGQLVAIEADCQLLRKRLGVEMTTVMRVEMKAGRRGRVRSRRGP